LDFIDVGGQKSEREKWEDVLSEGVDAVVFITAIDEFAAASSELDKTNLQVSMDVFQEVMKIQSLQQIPKLLFLNKLDLFTDHLESETGWSDFRHNFPNFSPNNPKIEQASAYIASKFSKRIERPIDSIHVGSCLNSDYIIAIQDFLPTEGKPY